MEICMKKGHNHLLGVLCYSATESVILFCTADELKHVSCSIVELMSWEMKPSQLRLLLSEAQITTFMTVWHSKPSTRDGEPHTPPQQTPPSG